MYQYYTWYGHRMVRNLTNRERVLSNKAQILKLKLDIHNKKLQIKEFEKENKRLKQTKGIK